MEMILTASIQSANNILPEPVARIGVSKLEADLYTITVNVWVNAHGYYDLMLALNEKLINGLKKAAIKLPGM